MRGWAPLRQARIAEAVIASAAVVLGGLIYVSYGSKSLLVFRWVSFLGCRSDCMALRQFARTRLGVHHDWILYNLPDGLWVFAGVLSLGLLWAGRTGVESWLWRLSPLVIAATAEFGQGLHIVPGTFDWLDMTAYVVGAASAFLILAWRSRL